MNTLQKQLWLLGLMRVVRMFMITMPIIVIYWQSHGLTVKDIFVLQVIFSIALVVLEIPSGYLADRLGNKNVIVFGSVTGILGYFLYWLIPSYAGFVAAELMLALSVSLMSGSRDALLHDTLSAHSVESDYTKYHGRFNAWGQVSEASAAILAGLIASSVSLSAVLAIQTLVLTLTVPIAFCLHSYQGNNRESDSLATIVRYCFVGNPRLLWLNLMTGAVGAATLTMVWFVQPHWKSLGVDLLYFGFFWAGLNFVVALGSVLAARIQRLIRFRVLFGLIAVAPLLLYAGMALLANSMVAVVFVSLFWLLRGIVMPIISDYVQREATQRNRATVLSANSLMIRLVFSVTSPFVGWVTDVYSFQMAFAASAIVFGFIAVLAFTNWLFHIETTATT